MIALEKYPRVWCPDCAEIQPVICDEMPAGDLNKTAALDFVCERCRSIICTLHEADK